MTNPLATSLKTLQQAVVELQAAGYNKFDVELAVYVLYTQPNISIEDLRTKMSDLRTRVEAAKARRR